jgi:hypothetical protein
VESTHRLLDGHVKDDHSDGEMSGSLEDNDDVKATDNGRRKKQQSPMKRRKIEHESSLLFEVLLLALTTLLLQFARNFKMLLGPHARTLVALLPPSALAQPAMSLTRVGLRQGRNETQCLVRKLNRNWHFESPFSAHVFPAATIETSSQDLALVDHEPFMQTTLWVHIFREWLWADLGDSGDSCSFEVTLGFWAPGKAGL